REILGREPSYTELGIFSVMWSEHCSYKSSRVHLRKLPTSGARVIQGPGENAGVVDIGDGEAVVFKMESHNHPSVIEPYQRAASATRSSTSAPARAATASTAQRWPPPSLAKIAPPSVPPCRWATRSPRSCSWRRAWS